MYSYEDRLRAVRLYIKLGKRVGLTIRQLGYPTKNALKGWHREFERCLDLPTGYVRGPRYSDTHKERATLHYLDNGRCLAATIRALGYPSRKLLSAWVNELHPQAVGGEFVVRQRSGARTGPGSAAAKRGDPVQRARDTVRRRAALA